MILVGLIQRELLIIVWVERRKNLTVARIHVPTLVVLLLRDGSSGAEVFSQKINYSHFEKISANNIN